MRTSELIVAKTLQFLKLMVYLHRKGVNAERTLYFAAHKGKEVNFGLFFIWSSFIHLTVFQGYGLSSLFSTLRIDLAFWYGTKNFRTNQV